MASTTPSGVSRFDGASTELAARRTGMAFQRTRLAADRTLMAVIRTSLSLISFGFTIHKIFESLKEKGVVEHAASERNFGISLVVIGLVLLLVGCIYHMWFMYSLRRSRGSLVEDELLHGQSPFPPSMTLFSALLLFAMGVVAFVSMTFQIGPFG